MLKCFQRTTTKQSTAGVLLRGRRETLRAAPPRCGVKSRLSGAQVGWHDCPEPPLWMRSLLRTSSLVCDSCAWRARTERGLLCRSVYRAVACGDRRHSGHLRSRPRSRGRPPFFSAVGSGFAPLCGSALALSHAHALRCGSEEPLALLRKRETGELRVCAADVRSSAAVREEGLPPLSASGNWWPHMCEVVARWEHVLYSVGLCRFVHVCVCA